MTPIELKKQLEFIRAKVDDGMEIGVEDTKLLLSEIDRRDAALFEIAHSDCSRNGSNHHSELAREALGEEK
jgi:hypothetical protein